MNNLRVVFSYIKKCEQAGTAEKDCYEGLRKLEAGRHGFISLYLYLEVLQKLGLTLFRPYGGEIALTEKGKQADGRIIFGAHAFILLSLFVIRQIFVFILFWPILLVGTRSQGEEKKNSAG